MEPGAWPGSFFRSPLQVEQAARLEVIPLGRELSSSIALRKHSRQHRLTSRNLAPEDASTPAAMPNNPPSLPNSMTLGQLGRQQHQAPRVYIPPAVARNMQMGRLDNLDGHQRARELPRSPLVNSVRPSGTPMRTTSTIGLAPRLVSPGTQSTLFGQPPRSVRTARTYRAREMTYSYEESENPNSSDVPEQEMDIHEDETAHPEYDDDRYYDRSRQNSNANGTDVHDERPDDVDHYNEEELHDGNMMAGNELTPAEQRQISAHEEHRAFDYQRVHVFGLLPNSDAAREQVRAAREIAEQETRVEVSRAHRQTDEAIERLEREMGEYSLHDNDHDVEAIIAAHDIEQRAEARLRQYHERRAAHLQYVQVAQEPDSEDEDAEANYQRGVEEVAQEYMRLLHEPPEARRYRGRIEPIAQGVETVQSNRRGLPRIDRDPDPTRLRERLRRTLQDYADSELEDEDEEGVAVASSPPAAMYERFYDRGGTRDIHYLRSPSASILSAATAAGSGSTASPSLQLPRPFSASPRRVSDYSALPAQPSMYPNQDDEVDRGRMREFNMFQAPRFGGASSSMDVQVGDSPFSASPARRNDSSQVDGSPDVCDLPFITDDDVILTLIVSRYRLKPRELYGWLRI